MRRSQMQSWWCNMSVEVWVLRGAELLLLFLVVLLVCCVKEPRP